jgi:predicted MPP superfamily phosphohydrolase
MIRAMPRMSRSRLNRFRAMVLAAVTLMQIPTVTWLVSRAHSLWPVGLALALSLPYLRRLTTPWEPGPRAPMYIALVWWTSCFVFDFLLVGAAIASQLGAPPDVAHLVAGALALGAGVIAVSGRARLVRRTVTIADLPQELDGYRIGHISDVHCGRDTPPSRVETWVRRLNALNLDLIAVTGDLITSGETYVDPVADALGGLRARDGVYACMGNHDYFTDGDRVALALERNGLTVLRNRGVTLRDRLHVAGVDDTWTSRDDMGAALAARPAGAPVVLLAHDPNLFPEAMTHDVDLMLSGHTHGGQLAVPGVRRLSLARFITEFTAGLYRRDRTWLYVNRGAGTTGPPVRLGAPAELAVLTLRRA